MRIPPRRPCHLAPVLEPLDGRLLLAAWPGPPPIEVVIVPIYASSSNGPSALPGSGTAVAISDVIHPHHDFGPGAPGGPNAPDNSAPWFHGGPDLTAFGGSPFAQAGARAQTLEADLANAAPGLLARMGTGSPDVSTMAMPSRPEFSPPAITAAMIFQNSEDVHIERGDPLGFGAQSGQSRLAIPPVPVISGIGSSSLEPASNPLAAVAAPLTGDFASALGQGVGVSNEFGVPGMIAPPLDLKFLGAGISSDPAISQPSYPPQLAIEPGAGVPSTVDASLIAWEQARPSAEASPAALSSKGEVSALFTEGAGLITDILPFPGGSLDASLQQFLTELAGETEILADGTAPVPCETVLAATVATLAAARGLQRYFAGRPSRTRWNTGRPISDGLS